MEIVAYDKKKAADALCVSAPTFDKISRMPGFPVVKLGNKILIPKKALENWLLELCENQ